MSMNHDNDPYNRGGLIAFIFCIAFSFIFFIWVSFFHPGIDLKELKQQPAGGDQTIAAQPAAKKVDISGVKNPWVSSDDMIAHGHDVFSQNCAVCHGEKGLGDGPAGKALNARNFVEGKWKAGGDRVSLFKTLQNGLAGTPMVGFPQLPPQDRWSVIHFIRSITNNKIKDDDKAVEKFAGSAK